jgi:ABC-2 type transport system permease protein
MRIFTIVKNDMKLFFSDWKAIVMFFGLPFTFVSLFILSLSSILDNNKFINSFNIAIVDKENTLESRMLINQFLSTEGKDSALSDDAESLVSFIKTDEDTALDLLDKGEAEGIIVIPEDFVFSMSVGENKPLKVITNPNKPLVSSVIKNYMQSYSDIISASQNGIMTAYVYYKKADPSEDFYEKKYSEAITRFSLKALSRNEAFTWKNISYIPDVTKYEYFTAALLVVFIMFSGIMGIKFTASEKQLGINARLNISPLKDIEFIISRLITVFILSLLQFLSIIIPGGLIFNIYLRGSFLYMMIMFIITVFTVSACAVFIAAIAPTPIAADLAGSLGTLLMAAVGGSIYPLISLPDSVKYLSYFTINRWAAHGFLEIFSGNITSAFYIDAAVLIVMGLVYLALSIPFLKLVRVKDI